MNSIDIAARKIADTQAALLKRQITADAFRTTMRTLRRELGEEAYMSAKFRFAARTSR